MTCILSPFFDGFVDERGIFLTEVQKFCSYYFTEYPCLQAELATAQEIYVFAWDTKQSRGC